MKPKEKYKLEDMLKEIEDDFLEYKYDDVGQDKNIPQETINELLLENLKKKKNKNS